MTWQILVAVSVVTFSLSVLLQRILLKNDKTDSIAFSIVFQLLTGILILLFAIIRGFSTPNLVPLLPNLILMIFLYGAANIFMFKALKIVEASEFTIVFATRAVWTIIAAMIFLKESFSLQQVVGTVFILVSVIMVSWQRELKINKGTLFSLLAAVAFGLAFVNDALILRNFDVPSYLGIAFIIPALVMWAVFPRSTYKMRPMFGQDFLKKIALLGVLYATSAITIFMAYQLGRNAAQIAPLNQTSTIIIVVLAIIFLKEKAYLARKVVGSIMSFVGIVLVG